MTTLTTANPRSVLNHAVYLRTPTVASPFINGEDTGWVFDPQLRCESIHYRTGPSCGRAVLRTVVTPTGGEHRPTDLASMQLILAKYGTDAQVKVEVDPLDGDPVVAFEGILMKQEVFAERLNASNDRENGNLIAIASPVLDNSCSDHIISGRWIVTDGPSIVVIESPSVPAIFNANGLPNMAPSSDTRYQADGMQPLTALAFSERGDNDSTAQWWTPREAISSLLVFWLYGSTDAGGDELSRTVCVSGELMQMLADESDPIWNARLPETNVHGLGVLDAIAAVCRSAGLDMAMMPDLRTPGSALPLTVGGFLINADRRYCLDIYAKNQGRANTIKLQQRSIMRDIDEATSLRQNDASGARLMRDALRTYSQVHARGRSLIEASFVLKPLWSPDDIAEDADSADAGQMQSTPDLSDLTYSARHVKGGSSYDEFKHIGRRWGIDCTGEFSPYGYTEADAIYYHDPAGFDFLNYLGLDSANDIASERADLGISEAIAWSKRLRTPQPIRRPDGTLRGIDWILEVSEDGGSNWTEIGVQFKVEREIFGITLTGGEVDNLAMVNAATFQTKAPPALADSWWTKILDKTLLFRLTCCVEADHAARYDAKITSKSATIYKRGRMLIADLAEYWAAPNSINTLSSSGTWQKLNHRGFVDPASADYVTNLSNQAELLQASWQQVPIAGFISTWVMDLGKWRLLDRITSILGRNIKLSTEASGGGAAISAITLHLRQDGQRITLELEDQRYTEGT